MEFLSLWRGAAVKPWRGSRWTDWLKLLGLRGKGQRHWSLMANNEHVSNVVISRRVYNHLLQPLPSLPPILFHVLANSSSCSWISLFKLKPLFGAFHTAVNLHNLPWLQYFPPSSFFKEPGHRNGEFYLHCICTTYLYFYYEEKHDLIFRCEVKYLVWLSATICLFTVLHFARKYQREQVCSCMGNVLEGT